MKALAKLGFNSLRELRRYLRKIRGEAGGTYGLSKQAGLRNENPDLLRRALGQVKDERVGIFKNRFNMNALPPQLQQEAVRDLDIQRQAIIDALHRITRQSKRLER